MEVSFHCKDDDSNSSSSSGGGGGARFMSEQEDPASVQLEHVVGTPLVASFTPSGPTPDDNLDPASTGPARATASSSSQSPKRSGRRSVHKRVVSIPIADAEGSRPKGGGECAPPSDSWAWRKYGQKPIKGSPYPRGYYRCSSSKGCPARKQVERSRADPNMLVVTYACEHNHPWPLPKNNHHNQQQQQQQQKQRQQHLSQQQPHPAAAGYSPKASPPEQEPEAPVLPGPLLTSSPGSAEETFATDLLGEEPSLQTMMDNEFGWFSDVSASPPPAEAFLGSIMWSAIAAAPPVLDDDDDVEIGGGDGVGDEESSLFAGLGELPECAVVFRRVRMQMEAEADRRRVTAARCCGTTG